MKPDLQRRIQPAYAQGRRHSIAFATERFGGQVMQNSIPQ